MDPNIIAAIVAALVGFLTAWGVGAADLANIMSTTLGSKAVGVLSAILIAIVFETLGALFGGNEVARTLRYDIIDTTLIHDPHILVHGFLAVSLAGASWMLIASSFGLPVSITNAIVGALTGLGLVAFGPQAIHWNKIIHIGVSWVTSPLLAGFCAYLIFWSIQRLILVRAHPNHYIERYFPVYCFVVGMIFAQMMVFKILHRYQIPLTGHLKFSLVIISGIVIAILGVCLGRRHHLPENADRHACFAYVEKKFGILMGFTACAMVFAHGSNDVPVAVGPLNAIFSVLSTETRELLIPHLRGYFLLFGSAGVITGLLMYGRKVIATVGSGITTLTPSRAFAATLAAACTVILSTSTGIPISATQTLVGGVLGVGLARGIGAINLTVVRNIFMSWFITIPAASALAILYFYLFDTFITSF